MLSAERPHVLTVEDGLRNVDCLRDYHDPSEFFNFLTQDCTLIGVGKNAFVFQIHEGKGFPSESIIRIEVVNVISISWSRELIACLKSTYPNFVDSITRLEENLDKRLKDLNLQTKYLIKMANRTLKKRIAAHNSAYRRNPGSCVPINNYVSYEGKLLAVMMKYLKGIPLRETTYPQDLLPDEVLVDCDTENILVDIENVGSDIQRHMIDVTDFVESNK
jgi:hypothetical protein